MLAIFSVIIPVYKVEKYIRECVESILAQTFTDFEAIFVEDCGGDSSASIIKEYEKIDKRVKLIQHDKNKGVGAARNTGIDNSKGEYITFVDSDDWLEPNCLETLYATLRNKNTSSVCYDAYLFDNLSKKRLKDHAINNRAGYLTITPETICRYSDYVMKAYTRSSIVDKKIRYPEGITFEDGEFYFKYFSLNPDTYIMSDCLYNYRINREGSIVTSAQRGAGNCEHVFQVVRNLRQFYIDNNLYDKYKCAILQLISLRITTCKNMSNNYNKAVELADSLLKDFGYPEEFENFNEKNPAFSIIVPFYNVEPYIDKCLNSIKKQTFSNFEVLCVDDRGTDNSRKIVEHYQKEDSRFKIITHSENKGLGAARNTAIKKAKGKYILFVDSDDWIDFDCLNQIYQKFQSTGRDTIWFKVNIWWEDTQQMTDMCNFRFYADIKEGKYTINDNLLAKFPTSTWNKAYSREFLINNNIYYPEGIYFEDVEMYFQTATKSPDIYIIDTPLYYYRRRSDSILGSCINDPKKAKDVFKAAVGVHKYMQENDLIKQYPKAYLNFVADIVNDFRSHEETQKALLSEIKKYLETIGFPDELMKI